MNPVLDATSSPKTLVEILKGELDHSDFLGKKPVAILKGATMQKGVRLDGSITLTVRDDESHTTVLVFKNEASQVEGLSLER